MQIIFRFNGSHELSVSNGVGGVLLERISLNKEGHATPPREWAIPTGVAGHAVNPIAGREECEFLLQLSKGEARSLASALMQAAAEA